MSYATAATAAARAGIDASKVTAAHIATTDEVINALMNRPYGLESVQTESGEYKDIPIAGINEVLLNNWPVVAITSVQDDAQSSSPTTLTSDNYYCGDDGVLKLLVPQNTTVSWIQTFTRGVSTVKVVYTYGYAAVPSLITELANIIAGMLGKNQALEDDRPGGGVQSIRIGDFQRTFAKGDFNLVVNMLGEVEKILLRQAIREYKVVV